MRLTFLQSLIEKARQQLSMADFSAFKQDSGQFMAGRLPAATLHSRIQALGMSSLVPDLAALCPDAQKRKELLQVHCDTFQSPSPSGVRSRPPAAPLLNLHLCSQDVCQQANQTKQNIVCRNSRFHGWFRGAVRAGCPRRLPLLLLRMRSNTAAGPARPAPS